MPRPSTLLQVPVPCRRCEAGKAMESYFRWVRCGGKTTLAGLGTPLHSKGSLSPTEARPLVFLLSRVTVKFALVSNDLHGVIPRSGLLCPDLKPPATLRWPACQEA